MDQPPDDAGADHPWADPPTGPRCRNCRAFLVRYDRTTWTCVICDNDYVIRANPKPDKEPTT
jgi:hypothetical protein